MEPKLRLVAKVTGPKVADVALLKSVFAISPFRTVVLALPDWVQVLTMVGCGKLTTALHWPAAAAAATLGGQTSERQSLNSKMTVIVWLG